MHLFYKLLRWFFFSVVIALVPIFCTFLFLAGDGKNFSLAEALAHGELLLIAVAIASDAIGDLIGSGKEKTGLKISCGAGCLLSVLCGSAYFGHVTSEPKVDANFVYWYSLWVFFGTLIASGSCKLLAEETRR